MVKQKTKKIGDFRGSQKSKISGTPEMQSISRGFENYVFKQSKIFKLNKINIRGVYFG